MSRMKDAHTFGRGGGAAWIDVSPRQRCPVCDADSWCQVSREGDTVLCKRVEGERSKKNREGVTFYVHHLNGIVRAVDLRPAAPQRDRAPADVRDRAYRIVLSCLRLDDRDHEALTGRGLGGDTIVANGYRTLPERGRAALARAVVDTIGETAAAAVPGIVWRDADDGSGRGWWSLSAAPGVLIPVRDLDGRMVALKVRRRDPVGDGPRYLYATSAKYGGASAASAVHVPRAALAMRASAPQLVVTEGELKADVSTALLGAPVVSIPGVGSWAAGVDAALAWGAREVAVALDMDAITNTRVALAVRLMIDALRAEGLAVAVWRWDPKFKGLDDHLAHLAARAAGANHGR
jgi:DNA primase